jgi:hypothetical protein
VIALVRLKARTENFPKAPSRSWSTSGEVDTTLEMKTFKRLLDAMLADFSQVSIEAGPGDGGGGLFFPEKGRE